MENLPRVGRQVASRLDKRVEVDLIGAELELDRSILDRLNDPLLHIVRNAVDHGIEAPAVRVAAGKSAVGRVSIEARREKESIVIEVRDDGGGIDLASVRARAIDAGLLHPDLADDLPPEDIAALIFHPGLSTAVNVSEVSGRGVGMDAVKTRINQLNGTIEVDSTPQQGTNFTIRLPLTLAIINSLLVRLRSAIFSMPIDDVREIVSVKERDIVNVHGKQTFDVRGEFIPLVSIDDVFQWHGVDYGRDAAKRTDAADTGNDGTGSNTVEVVILHVAGKTMGLRVDEPLGSRDIVIKSLSDNFINIRGLSGASMLGDGSISLMLDVGTVINMARGSSRTAET
jgi:two-component system chemotaxis sensor kinase CheA